MTKKSHYEYPCITFKQGNQSLICFVANAKELYRFLKINRRHEDKDEGYQRALSPSRVSAIAKFIDAGNIIPNSIIVSLDKAKIKEKSVIQIPFSEDSGWVIDGQHRLAGAYEAKSDIMLNVIAFVGLEEDDQIQQFVTINREAKGVPTSLYIDLLPRLKNKNPSDLAKERAADLATLLRRDENSPFFNRIVVTTSPKKGELSLANFVRKVSPLILEGKGILAAYPELLQKAVLINYYHAIKNVFPKEFKKQESIFFQTLGFGALINALPTIFSISITHYHGFTLENVITILKRIDFFDFDKWKSYGTGNSAEIQAGDDIRAEISNAYADKEGDDMLKV